jgi:hypothetical protein
MASPQIQYGLRWSVEMVAIPLGAGPMSVPDQQRVKVTQASPGTSNLPGNMIAITSTGAYPTSANVSTACTSMATAAAAALNNAAATVNWQAWNSGGG